MTSTPYKDTDLAYIAGLFDGEGCVYISNSPEGSRSTSKHRLVCFISNRDKPVLDWVKSLFGGSISWKSSGGDKGSFQLCIPSNPSLHFLETIFPYLKIKRAKASQAIIFQKQKRPGGHVSEAYKQAQELAFISFKAIGGTP